MRGFHFGPDGARPGEKRFASRGQARALAGSLEQGTAQFVLQLGDLDAEGGLRDRASNGGLREPARLGHGEEVAELVCFHFYSSNSFDRKVAKFAKNENIRLSFPHLNNPSSKRPTKQSHHKSNRNPGLCPFHWNRPMDTSDPTALIQTPFERTHKRLF
jgi:hypothetical protein